MGDNESKDLEWNIGKHRVQHIGELTGEVRDSFKKALQYPTEGRVDNYKDSLEALFFDIRAYIEEDNFLEEVNQLFDEADDVFGSPEDRLIKLKEVDKKLQEKRLDLGLDIPSKTSADSILD